METLGAILQRERVARGLSLEEIVDRSKLSPIYLQALESDDWGSIPSEVFARGFVKIYARCLELNDTDLLAAHGDTIHAFFEAKEAESREAEERREQLRREVQARTRSRLVRVGMALLGLASVGAVLILATRSPRQEETHTVAEIPIPTSPNSPSEAAHTVSEKTIVPPTPEISSEPAHRMILKARETTWAQVLIDDITKREVLLQPGDSVIWDADRTLELDVGNAGGVTVTFDGREFPPLGEPGQVLKGVVFPRPPVIEKTEPEKQ